MGWGVRYVSKRRDLYVVKRLSGRADVEVILDRRAGQRTRGRFGPGLISNRCDLSPELSLTPRDRVQSAAMSHNIGRLPVSEPVLENARNA